MSEDISIWMPIFWADYMQDAEDLALHEHGAYFMLMRAYWNNQGPLKNDRERLYRRCKAISETDRQTIDYILDNFFTEKNGKFSHKRIDFELINGRRIKRVRSEAGRQSGLARRTKREQMNEQNHQQKGNPSPTPTPTPILEVEKNKNNQKPTIQKSTLPRTRARDEGIFKFDVLMFLDDSQLELAKKAKPKDWDFYHLAETYSKWITGIGKPPDNTLMAFINWMKKYTKTNNLQRTYG